MAEHLEVWLIILLVIGVIASNLAVLKYSSKFKMPQFGQQQKSVDDAAKAHGTTEKPATPHDVKPHAANDAADDASGNKPQ